MRSELNGRRLRERWELAVIDSEDRQTYAHSVALECDLAKVSLSATLSSIQIAELEDQVASQAKELSVLSAARELLLQSEAAARRSVDELRVQLAREVKDSKALQRDLDLSHTKSEEFQIRIEELEEQVEEARAEAGEKSLADKEVEVDKLRSSLEKEKAARVKVDADLSTSKVLLNIMRHPFALNH